MQSINIIIIHYPLYDTAMIIHVRGPLYDTAVIICKGCERTIEGPGSVYVCVGGGGGGIRRCGNISLP